MLTTIEHLALDMGFAVSMVSLSREVSCHNLFYFYGRVASAIRTPDSTVLGIQRVLNKKEAADLPETPIQDEARYIHPLPAIVLEDYLYTGPGEEQDLLYSNLMGVRLYISELRRIHRANRREIMPKFPNFKMGEHAPAYFGVMADIVRFCGYRGWVILIDEIELIGRLGKVSRLKAYSHINWLLNWSETMDYPIYVLGASASSMQDTWFGGYGRRREDRKAIPELAEEKLGKAAREEINRFFEKALNTEVCPVIQPVAEDGLVNLLKKLVEIHGIAYGWPAELDVSKLIHQIGSKPIRTHIRAALEALDMSYVYQETVTPKAVELTESELEESDEFFAHPEVEGDQPRLSPP